MGRYNQGNTLTKYYYAKKSDMIPLLHLGNDIFGSTITVSTHLARAKVDNVERTESIQLSQAIIEKELDGLQHVLSIDPLARTKNVPTITNQTLTDNHVFYLDSTFDAAS
ncbi:hypothetical protein sscle_02g020690 [Sclerotinia sclerotiorum 1980 UF-70]|uniref:Uncharacterized protein n=1 Tax=Sclerotinia sclerotiorum (strain ATCC 18683 / 1980 / Ss-1) TaxID=665079 RepID=A0A1D9PXH7_SCLS1|nr:hypothetical protein sscle_02g020690 [Sclerotinia sclerotiorum 1980 UF-70]